MHVTPDLRLLALAAALTAGSEPGPGPVHPLVADNRSRLAHLKSHPSIRWLLDARERAWMLGLGMQAVQLGPAPGFRPAPPEAVPEAVRRYFSDQVTGEELGHHLRILWAEGEMAALFEAQRDLWAEAAGVLRAVLEPAGIPIFAAMVAGAPLGAGARSRPGAARTAGVARGGHEVAWERITLIWEPLVSGDRGRANDPMEQPEDRAWHLKAAFVCLGVAILAGLLAWAIS